MIHICPNELAALAVLVTTMGCFWHVVTCWKHRACTFVKKVVASRLNRP